MKKILIALVVIITQFTLEAQVKTTSKSRSVINQVVGQRRRCVFTQDLLLRKSCFW
jgi:hypothetical protein